MCKKVVLGLSGGMDSAYAAIKLLEAGYDVTAVNIVMCDSCDSSGQARDLALSLGIGFNVIDARSDFEKLVIKPFANAYVNGQTPNPCVLCNPLVKFNKLFAAMEACGADYVATGHYAVPVCVNGRWSFSPAKDTKKDQGYFLYGLSQQMLPKILMPLGGVCKSDIKAYFSENAARVSPPKTESTDICFVNNVNYTEIVSAHAVLPPAGDFVDECGKVLGKHKGIHNYTVGQRKGLGIALGKPAYVSAINSNNNTVTLSVDSAVAKGFSVNNITLMAVSEISVGQSFYVRVRYRAKPVKCLITDISEYGVVVAFCEEHGPVALGQSAVFYLENGIIAFGGVIC